MRTEVCELRCSVSEEAGTCSKPLMSHEKKHSQHLKQSLPQRVVRPRCAEVHAVELAPANGADCLRRGFQQFSCQQTHHRHPQGWPLACSAPLRRRLQPKEHMCAQNDPSTLEYEKLAPPTALLVALGQASRRHMRVIMGHIIDR